jgi:hypothetical protein
LASQYIGEAENSMDMSVIEQILWDAVERGVLNADTVDEVVVRMRGADTDLQEAQAVTEDRGRRVAEALDEYNQAISSVVLHLNRAANNLDSAFQVF